MEYACVARRKGTDWWIGAINNSMPRKVEFRADFLSDGTYTAEIYTDTDETATDPNRLEKRTVTLRKGDMLTLPMAGSGGAAIHIYPTR